MESKRNAKREKDRNVMKFFRPKEKPTEEKKKGRKKTLIILSAAGVFIMGTGIGIFFLIKPRNNAGNMERPYAMDNLGEGIIAAGGLTTVGMLDETWELDFLQTALYVEESYLSMGDEVEEGTAVFKVSDKTLEEARKELEDAVTEARLAYRQGVIDYEAGVIDARVANENAAVNKKYSQAQYDSASAEAAQTVKELEKQAEEAGELVDEYTKSVNEDYYRTYYKIDELYQTYQEHFSLLMETYEKWNIKEKENSSGNSASGLGDASGSGFMESGSQTEPSGKTMGGGYSESNTLLSVYNLLDEMVKQEGEEYETALENYDTARRTAQAGLEKARSDLASLEAELVTARTEYEKQLIACQSEYEITLAESDNAQAVYEVTVESLEETLSSLKNEKEEAAENLALFEEVIGDGYFYTKSAGTIVMSGVSKGSYLSGENLVVAYSNPEKVSVTANVDQSDIAGISIGDRAYAVINEYGNYQGKVTMINPVTQAQSRSSVTYQVTVALEGDVTGLDSNLTSYVYFGMSDEMMQEIQNITQDGDDRPGRDGRGVPEKGNMPWNGPETEEIKGDPETEDRSQEEENIWTDNIPQPGDTAPAENGRKEGGNERKIEKR